MGRRWTESEIKQLRELWGSMSASEIGRRLGRTYYGIHEAAHKAGLSKKRDLPARPWTEDELERLRELYLKVPAREIARRLGRSPAAIYRSAGLLGLTEDHRIRFDDGVCNAIRRLNSQGFTDTEISQELRCDRHAVTAHRKRLGLPDQQYGQRRRSRTRAATDRQCQASGVETLGELRALTYRIRALKAGWPVDLRWRSVQILELLEKNGPMTKRQIAEAIGIPWRGASKTLRSNDKEGTYLANLVARGLVLNLGRFVYQGGPNKNVCLYSIGPSAERKVPC